MSTVLAFVLLACRPRGEAREVVARAAEDLEAGKARAAIEALDGLAADAGFESLPVELQARALAILGLASEAVDDPESAASSLERAIELPAGSMDAVTTESVVLSLARSSLEMKDGAAARRALERLGPEACGKEPIPLLLALARLLEGDERGAEAGFESVLRRGPSVQASFQVGVIRFDRGQREEALARFEEATRRGPQDYYAWIYRARALLELNRPQEAVEVAGKMAELGFDTAELHYLLGKARLREERFEEAAASFRKAIAAQPDYGEAFFGLGTSLRRLGKVSEARGTMERFQTMHRKAAERLRESDALSQALLRSPKDAGIAEALARASLDSGDLEAAGRHAWRAVRLDAGRASARLILARVLVREGRYGAAAVHYQRILRSDPGNADARAELEALVATHSKRPR